MSYRDEMRSFSSPPPCYGIGYAHGSDECRQCDFEGGCYTRTSARGSAPLPPINHVYTGTGQTFSQPPVNAPVDVVRSGNEDPVPSAAPKKGFRLVARTDVNPGQINGFAITVRPIRKGEDPKCRLLKNIALGVPERVLQETLLFIKMIDLE